MARITKKHLLITPLVLSLSGCMGVYEGGFECPPGKGVGCKSISEVNELINKGALPKKDDQESDTCACENSKSEKDDLSKIGEPQEEKIWIAPWAFEESF